MSVSLPHALSVWWRNASMYRRTWTVNILPNFFEPVFYLTAMGIGVGAYIQEMGGMSYVAFLVPGLVCVAAMNGASYEATASAPGFASGNSIIGPQLPGSPVMMMLGKGATLTVRVQCEGSDCEDAWVALDPAQGESWDGHELSDEGTVAFEDLAPGHYVVEAASGTE